MVLVLSLPAPCPGIVLEYTVIPFLAMVLVLYLVIVLAVVLVLYLPLL